MSGSWSPSWSLTFGQRAQGQRLMGWCQKEQRHKGPPDTGCGDALNGVPGYTGRSGTASAWSSLMTSTGGGCSILAGQAPRRVPLGEGSAGRHWTNRTLWSQQLSLLGSYRVRGEALQVGGKPLGRGFSETPGQSTSKVTHRDAPTYSQPWSRQSADPSVTLLPGGQEWGNGCSG